MALTKQDMINNGLLNELANRFTTPPDADYLLSAIGLQKALIPIFDRFTNPLAFWLAVSDILDGGVLDDGFRLLLEVAHKRLPANPVFKPFGPPPARPPSAPEVAFASNYDVFLSFSSKDRDFVREIAKALKSCGLNPWLDEWALRGGDPFVKEIGAILSVVPAIAVFYGSDGYGPWQEAEVDIALQRQVRGQCRVIPVMLPGVTSANLPPFLRRLNAVRIRPDVKVNSVTLNCSTDELINAIRGN